jgi:hypothetical protein
MIAMLINGRNLLSLMLSKDANRVSAINLNRDSIFAMDFITLFCSFEPETVRVSFRLLKPNILGSFSCLLLKNCTDNLRGIDDL